MEKRGLLLLVVASSVMTACGQTHPKWVEQTGGGAYQVKTPKGWTVSTAADSHITIRSADGSQFVLLEPVKTGSEVHAAQAIQALVKHWTGVFPNAQLSEVKQVSDTPDEVVAKVIFGAGSKQRANVLFYNQNGAGMFYAICAPTSKFEASRSLLVDVLSSFRFGKHSAGAGVATSPSGLKYEPWTDPSEQAFTVQVPRGWKVSGGLTRVSPIDLRTEITATSPDGQVQAQYGSAKMLPFKPLTGTIFARGFHQGSISEYHGWFMFLDYETGDVFSKGYLNLVLSKQYSGLQIGESKDRPDIQAIVEKCFANAPIKYQVSVGETDFTYNDNGETKSGVCLATTILSAPGSASQGWVAIPAICTAPADKLKEGLEVLAHLAVPKYSSTWIANMNGQASNYTKNILATAQGDRALSDNIYQKFVNQMSDADRPLQNLLTGTVDLKDANGHTFQAAAGKNYYSSVGGSVVGGDAPNVGFTPLTQY